MSVPQPVFIQPQQVQSQVVLPQQGQISQQQQPSVISTVLTSNMVHTVFVATAPPINPVDKAKEIHIAVQGFGTNDKELIRVLGNMTPEQALVVAAEYQKAYGRSLKSELHKDTWFNFRHVVEALVTPMAEFKADYLYDAIDGPGTKNHVLMDVLCHSSNAEIRAIIQTYAAKYGNNKLDALAQDIVGDTSGDFQTTLLEILKANRDETGIIDQNSADNDAKTLYQAGEGRLGTDDSTFIRIFTSRSNPQLAVIDQSYRTHSKKKHSLLEAIEHETSFNYKDTLLALAKPWDVYWSERIHKAIDGLGTDDRLLIYAIVTNRAFKKICETYEVKYGHSLESDIADDTSGDYEKMLLEIVKYRSQF